MNTYNHLEIEKKWQAYWEENQTNKTNVLSDKPKYYTLSMFPYPSGAGLHVGHPESYTAIDIVGRMKRMQGFEVLNPMGWDAFGLPAEQFALKTGNHPAGFTNENIATFKKQIQSLGFGIDWEREIATTDPKYYKWTQWIFTQLYNKGLAELKELPVNFCPECKTVLANEEVIDGRCERGDHLVVKKNLKQWELKITEYAERLLADLDDLDWPEALKSMQRNWIGKSVGVTVNFKLENHAEQLETFTTRADTLYGVTYVVIAPEHRLVEMLVTADQAEVVKAFIEEQATKSDMDRTELNKDKSGVFTGSYALNPLTNKRIPILIGDYVLATYGTGAVMGVPAHDERDYEFAKKYDLEMIQVVEGDISEKAFTADGIHINSDLINGMMIEEAIETIANHLKEIGLGEKKVNYKLRDWLFSRQRYWGEPFPVVHMEDGTIKLLDESELPVELPHMTSFAPGEDGTSPLANAADWLDYTDPITGKKGKRETNTMPQWAGSCWYYLRYLDPHNEKEFISKEIADKWLPVDLYIGGAEHAVLHLLYARFWHKVLYDLGYVSAKEPFQKLINQGMILGENNEKMSKSKGNVVNPDHIVERLGADTLRLYEMFMGPLEATIAWSEDKLDGARKFLDRVWRFYEQLEIIDENPNLDVIINQSIDKVTKDYANIGYNTAIAQLMTLLNAYSKEKKVSQSQAEIFVQLLAPVAPHICEELWTKLGHEQSIFKSDWPAIDETKLANQTIEIVIQINGKIKGRLNVTETTTADEQLELAKEALANELVDKQIVKVINVPQKIVNLIIK